MIGILNKHHRPIKGEYIGRGSPLGNPFIIGTHGTRDEVCDQYEAWLNMHLMAQTPSIINELVRLANIARQGDLNLICFSAPKRCHGLSIKHVLEEIISTSLE